MSLSYSCGPPGSALLVLKMLAFVSKKRAEHHGVNPVTTKAERVKLVGLVISTLGFDVIWGCSAAFVFKEAGVSTICLLLFDPVNIAIESILTTVKYVVKGQDFNKDANDSDEDETDGASDQEESVVLYFSMLYYVDFVASLLKLGLSLCHFVHIWVLNGLSFTLIDAILFLNMRSSALKLTAKVSSHMNYRRIVDALENNTTTVQEISEIDDVCAICLRKMTKNVKKLPCGHYYHFGCLCRWLERLETNPTCPVCRKPLLSDRPQPRSGNIVDASSVESTARNTGNNDNHDQETELERTTTLSLNLTVNLNVEGQPRNDSETGGRFSSILSWPGWLPTPNFSLNVTPTQGGRDALDAAHNQDSGQNSTLQAENVLEDDAELKANNVDVEPGEKVEFSLAEPFHDSPEARHAAFQERKARLLEEARRRYRQKKEEERLRRQENAGLSSYFI